jgi:hypothetical protein
VHPAGSRSTVSWYTRTLLGLQKGKCFHFNIVLNFAAIAGECELLSVFSSTMLADLWTKLACKCDVVLLKFRNLQFEDKLKVAAFRRKESGYFCSRTVHPS